MTLIDIRSKSSLEHGDNYLEPGSNITNNDKDLIAWY